MRRINKGVASFSVFLREQRPTILNLVIFAIIADIVFFSTNLDVRLFTILSLYIGCVFFYKLRSTFTFAISLLLLGIMFVTLLITGTSVMTEKAAVWIFFFILVGIIQQTKE